MQIAGERETCGSALRDRRNKTKLLVSASEQVARAALGLRAW